jgi:hypothetical protein
MSLPRQGLLLTDGLRRLASMLGVKTDHAEDALHSERAAQAVLSRRNLFAAAGAMAAGTAFSFPAPEKLYSWHISATEWVLLDEVHKQIGSVKWGALAPPYMIFRSRA